jgi:hypothetical protein
MGNASSRNITEIGIDGFVNAVTTIATITDVAVQSTANTINTITDVVRGQPIDNSAKQTDQDQSVKQLQDDLRNQQIQYDQYIKQVEYESRIQQTKCDQQIKQTQQDLWNQQSKYDRYIEKVQHDLQDQQIKHEKLNEQIQLVLQEHQGKSNQQNQTMKPKSNSDLTLYVLLLENNKFYVGTTERDIPKRFQEHVNGCGSGWTKLHKPIGIFEIVENVDRYDEDKYTKKYMDLYGVDNVRGGTYCQTTLTLQRTASGGLTDVRRINAHENAPNVSETGLPVRCKEFGHYYDACPQKH